ncbi:hypothetical protein C2E23DRAFT_489251 [Lenzites betulinus]|nr:hypothetical protein C2E23DRAFT_489251 [Lenzites betulinus]
MHATHRCFVVWWALTLVVLLSFAAVSHAAPAGSPADPARHPQSPSDQTPLASSSTSDTLGFSETDSEAAAPISRQHGVLSIEMPSSVPHIAVDSFLSPKAVEIPSRPAPADALSIPSPRGPADTFAAADAARLARRDHPLLAASDGDDTPSGTLWPWSPAGPLAYGAVILLVGGAIGWACENFRIDL